ncbi:MAG TPA: GNAT family N-acetyltransferase [Bacteroidia bacterium]|nr:GNAT family N-acetyltransferase [Bacteroidia bacterium]
MNTQTQIIFYKPELALAFKEINIEWLEKYFHVTGADLEILNNPEKIINSGGLILFAKVGTNVVGTAALEKVDDEVYELIKMGVRSEMQGKGIGKLLLHSILEEARKLNARKVLLETAAPLTAAIALYKKGGFIRVGEEEKHPKFGRITFKMLKLLR